MFPKNKKHSKITKNILAKKIADHSVFNKGGLTPTVKSLLGSFKIKNLNLEKARLDYLIEKYLK